MTQLPLTTTSGKLRIHLEIAPGSGALENLLNRLEQTTHPVENRTNETTNEIVLGNTNAADAKMLVERFPHLSHYNMLDADVVARILAHKPKLLIIPSISDPTLSESDHQLFINNIIELLNQNIGVKTTFPMVAYERVNDLLSPPLDWPSYARITGNFLRQYVADYIVHDIPPSQILERHLQGEIKWPEILAHQQSALLKMQNLYRLRELMFLLVSAHASDIASRANPALRDLPANNGTLWSFKPIESALSLATIILVTVLAYVLWDANILALSAATILMLGAVVMVALNTNLVSTFVAITASLLFYDYLFIPPFHSILIEGWANIATFAIYAAICFATALLANTAHTGETNLKFQAQFNRAILRLAYDINYIDNVDGIIESALHTLKRTMGLNAAVILTDQPQWQSYPPNQLEGMSGAEIALIRKTVTQNVIQPTLKGQSYVWCPVQQGQTAMGVIGVQLTSDDQPATAAFPSVNFLRNYAGLLGNAIRRVQLKQDQGQASMQASRESLRSSLLASVSHDLKTPLVSIIGGLSTLEFMKDNLPEKDRMELLASARTEAERLHRMVHNVLEMAKLESGAIVPRREPVDLPELATATATRVQRARPDLAITFDKPNQNQLRVQGDELLLSQIIYNLLDNAAKYGNPTEPVLCRIAENPENNLVELVIADNGPGITEHERDKIFDKFFRSSQTDQRQAGSGLGLAICRAIARAHGGDVTVGPRHDGLPGAAFSLTLPAIPNFN